MKNLLIIVVLLVSFSNSHMFNSVKHESSNRKENFDWLIGNWQRINEKENKETFETWYKKSKAEYVGYGYTLQNNDTIWQENIKLNKSNEGWSFEVIGKGENKPTIFKLISIGKKQFTSENKQNEFPKQIQYFKKGKNINAIISDGDMEILFEFKKLDDSE